jgi:hypothetical protein
LSFSATLREQPYARFGPKASNKSLQNLAERLSKEEKASGFPFPLIQSVLSMPSSRLFRHTKASLKPRGAVIAIQSTIWTLEGLPADIERSLKLYSMLSIAEDAMGKA